MTVLATLVMSSAPADAAPRKPVGNPRGRDTAPPTVVVPADITVDAMATIGAYVAYTFSVTDNKDPSPTVTVSHPSGSTFPIGTTTVTVTATDWKLNSTTATFNVTVLSTGASSFAYKMEWPAPLPRLWEHASDTVIWFEWSMTVSADGTVSGSGEQLYLLEEYSQEEYAVPMPSGLTGAGDVSGTISADGSSALDASISYWTWIDGDYDAAGDRVYTEYTYASSGTTQASLDAAGNLFFTGGYNAYWTKN